jgi:ribonucleoside-diphosphate reductase alpha chain
MNERKMLPPRRKGWTQKCRIGDTGQSFYLRTGEYEDGTLGEIFLDAHKEGTFTRGILDSLARTVSVSLQSGTSLEVVVKTLRLMHYPPNGPVEGSDMVSSCTSIADWVAQELEAYYITRETRAIERLQELREETEEKEGERIVSGDMPYEVLDKALPLEEKIAGFYNKGSGV